MPDTGENMDRDMKYCRNCGKQIPRSAKFCRYCGFCLTAGAPAPSARRDEAPAAGTPEKRSGTAAGIRLVAGVLVLALLFTGFVSPGFLRRGNGGGEGNAEYIPDLKAIARLEPETAPVTVKGHTAEAGGLTFDFDVWNLEGDDTVEVRDAGTKELPGATLRMIDISLASGQREFLTSVEVVIPMLPGEENATVETFDEEKGAWYPVAYRVSEDGGSFVVRTDHFSVKAIRTEKQERSSAEAAAEYVNITDGSSRNFFSVRATDPETGKAYPALQEQVVYERADAVRLLYAVQPEITAVLRSEGVQAEAVCKTEEQAACAKACEAIGYEDAVNSFTALRDNVLGGVSAPLGGYLWMWSAMNTVLTTIGELSKNDEAYPIIKRNMPALIGTVAGAVTTAAALGAAVSGVAVIAATVTGITCMLYPAMEEFFDEKPRCLEEEIYFQYLGNAVYLGEDLKFTEFPSGGSCIQLKTDGTGWEEAFARILKKDKGDPEALERDIAALYDGYLGRFFAISKDARYSYVKRTCDEGEITGLIYGDFWKGFIDFYDEEQMVGESASYMAHAKDILTEHTKELLCKVIRSELDRFEEKTSAEMREQVVPFLNQKLEFQVKDTGLPKGQRFFDSVYSGQGLNPLERYFSEAEPFSVPWRHQDEYDYAAWPIVFNEPTPMRFVPANRTGVEYSAYRFTPHAVKGSDLVFVCSRYFYMAIGSPTTMLFRGPGGEVYPPVPADFRVPDRDTTDYVTVTVTLEREQEEPGGDLSALCGYWRTEVTVGEDYGICFTQGNDGSFIWYNVSSRTGNEHSAIVSTYPEYKWDAKTKTLTLSATRQWPGKRGEYVTEPAVISMQDENTVYIAAFRSHYAYRITEQEFIDGYEVEKAANLTVPGKNDVSYDVP